MESTPETRLYILTDGSDTHGSALMTEHQYQQRCADTNQHTDGSWYWIPAPTQTREAIADLKQNWLNDSCYDLEQTPFFEAHYAELLAFRREQEAAHARQLQERYARMAEQMGVAGNLELARYVRGLELRIEQLEEQIATLR